MVLFLKVLLQWSTKAESSIVTTVTSSNQVLMVVSDSSWLSRLSTLSHRSFMEFKQKLPFRRRLSVFLRGKMAGGVPPQNIPLHYSRKHAGSLHLF